MRAGKRSAKLLTLLMIVWCACGAAEAYSQRLYLNGGANVSPQSVSSKIAGTSAAFQAGMQFESSDYVRFRLGATFQNIYSIDGLVQVHVLGDREPVNPYLMAGYGYYLTDGTERGVLPAGVGLEYDLSRNVALNVELSGRFGVNAVQSGERLNMNVMSSLLPGIGITYKPERIERRPPGTAPPLSREEKPKQQQVEFEGRLADSEVSSPFADPVSGSQTEIQEFDVPYTLDSLKRADPLIVRRGESTPHDDPGQAPISGSPTLSNDGTMVRLPDGSFIMGLTDEDPLDIQNAGRKKVTVSSFYVDRFEVTNEEYREYLDDLSGQEREQRVPDSTAWSGSASNANWRTYFYGSERGDFPVVAVTWEDAEAYCEWDGKRLPTEAEWEYAARAGRVGGVYPWAGFSPRDPQGRYLANFNPGRQGQASDGYAFTAPVGSYPPNRWGLHDVAGNVAEWVEDAYTPSYSALSGLDPIYTDSEENRRVVRGGSWSSNAFQIGVGVRGVQPMNQASARIGFRCAADISSIEGDQESFGPQPTPPPQNQPQQGADAPDQQGSPGQGQASPPPANQDGGQQGSGQGGGSSGGGGS